jgi:hypothetical protein
LKKDMIVSLVLLAGIVSLYLSLGFMDDPRAATFPRVVIIIMGILAALLLLQSLLLKKPESSKGSGFPFGRFLICFVMIILYFVFMESLGILPFGVSVFCRGDVHHGKRRSDGPQGGHEGGDRVCVHRHSFLPLQCASGGSNAERGASVGLGRRKEIAFRLFR